MARRKCALVSFVAVIMNLTNKPTFLSVGKAGCHRCGVVFAASLATCDPACAAEPGASPLVPPVGSEFAYLATLSIFLVGLVTNSFNTSLVDVKAAIKELKTELKEDVKGVKEYVKGLKEDMFKLAGTTALGFVILSVVMASNAGWSISKG
ncbi:unnamed protein product [Symbiodinium sp. CCMP2456]|nr:unnamed protein product [Symbiodinium sp. CCMP2456]